MLCVGLVEQIGAPLAPHDNPDNQFVAGLFGKDRKKLFSAHVKGMTLVLPDFDGQALPLPPIRTRLVEHAAVTLGIGPEHFRGGGSAALDLTIEIIEIIKHLSGESSAYARQGRSNVLTIATNGGRA